MLRITSIHETIALWVQNLMIYQFLKVFLSEAQRLLCLRDIKPELRDFLAQTYGNP